MSILFTRFPLVSARRGGAENQTMALMEGLRAKGHSVRFLGGCDALLERTARLKMENGKLKIGSPPVTKWGAVSFLWRRKRMKKSLMEQVESLRVSGFKFQVCVMLSLTEKLLLTEWLAAQGINVLWIEHDRIGPWLSRNPWLPALRRASAHATIVCVSELSRKKYIELGFDPARIRAIPNGVAGVESGKWKVESVGQTSLRILCVARLSPEKGVDVLIQALAQVPEAELTLVGTGPDEGYIRTLTTENQVREGVARVRLIPHVDDLEPLFAACDALVLPSRDHDPFGLVAAEAMVRGIPVIVTDVCGIAGYLSSGSDAIVVPAENPGALADAIRSLQSPELRALLGGNGQRTALEKFSSPRMIERYGALLREP